MGGAANLGYKIHGFNLAYREGKDTSPSGYFYRGDIVTIGSQKTTGAQFFRLGFIAGRITLKPVANGSWRKI